MNIFTSSARSRPSLRANFSWTFAGNLVYAGCQWGMLVVLAKVGSPEMVGQFALGLAITAPVMMFTNLNLREIQATDARHEYQFGDYLGLRLVTTTLALLVIVVAGLVSGYRWETALVILAVGVAKAFETISDIFYGLLQQHESMERVARSLMLKGPLSLAALSIGTSITGTVFWGVVGLAAAWALILFGYDVRNGALVLGHIQPKGSAANAGAWATVPRPDRQTLIRLAWLALPLGVVMMLASLSSAVPRYFVERYLGERELGIFAAIAYLQVAGTTVISALGQSASPRLATYYAAGKASAFGALLVKLVGIAVLLGGTGVLISLVAGQVILGLLYRPEYARHAGLMVWMMVAAGIGYVAWFLGDAMTAARYLRAQVPLFVLSVSAALLTCIWLIPSIGLYGAAMAMISAAVVQLTGSLAVVTWALWTLRNRTETL